MYLTSLCSKQSNDFTWWRTSILASNFNVPFLHSAFLHIAFLHFSLTLKCTDNASQNQTQRKFMSGFTATSCPFTGLRRVPEVKSLYLAIHHKLIKGFYICVKSNVARVPEVKSLYFAIHHKLTKGFYICVKSNLAMS